MSELTVLQAVRLKGRVSEADLVATLVKTPLMSRRRVAQTHRRRAAGRREDVRTSFLKGASGSTPFWQGSVRVSRPERLAKTGDGDFRVVNNESRRWVFGRQIKHGQPNSHDDAE